MPQLFPTMFAVGKLSPGTSRGDAPLAGALRAWDPGWDPGPSAERLCSGSCSAGAGPTGGTNAFASRGAAPSPRSPGRTARARKGCRRAPLGAGRVRGPGSGVGVWGPGGGLAGGEQRPRSASGGAPSAGRPRTRRPDMAPRSPPVGWAGAGWVDAGLGGGWLGGDGPDQVGVGLGWTGAGTGVCWSSAGLSWPWVGWDSGESWAGAGPGIRCWAPITDQGSRIGSFSLFLLLLII